MGNIIVFLWDSESWVTLAQIKFDMPGVISELSEQLILSITFFHNVALTVFKNLFVIFGTYPTGISTQETSS